MSADDTEDVTTLLRQWNEGDSRALDQLIPLVYDRLQRLAHQRLRGEYRRDSIQTGTLVHEAYLRLMKCSQVKWEDREHFFSLAVREMRRVLVEEARRRNSQKRGEGSISLPLDKVVVASREQDQKLIALDEALGRLEGRFPRKSRVLELRYFLGLSDKETAEVLGVSADVVKRDLRTAKLWLMREMGGDRNASGKSKAD